MTFDQLNYFITIVETGSMTHAAKQLNIAQPALSRTIQRLEQELEIQLFDRNGKNLILNENGDSFLQFAKQCVNSLNTLKNKYSTEETYGSLVIGNQFENENINKSIASFASKFPGINIDVFHTSQVEDPGIFQFFFATSDYENSYLNGTLDSAELWQDDMVVLVRKDHPLALHDEIALSDAKNYPFILPRESGYLQFINHLFKLAGFTPLSSFKTNDQAMLVELVRNTDYVAVMPNYNNIYGDRNDFKILKISDPKFVRHISLFWPTHIKFTKSEIAFRDFIIRYFNNN